MIFSTLNCLDITTPFWTKRLKYVTGEDQIIDQDDFDITSCNFSVVEKPETVLVDSYVPPEY